jgi:hypothetical protein
MIPKKISPLVSSQKFYCFITLEEMFMVQYSASGEEKRISPSGGRERKKKRRKNSKVASELIGKSARKCC